MGCRGSKAEHPLVSRCRERRELILAAADHRYAFAASHTVYFRSLKNLGVALQNFVDEELVTDQSSGSSPSSSHFSRKGTDSNEPPLLNPSYSSFDNGTNSEGDDSLSHRQGFAPNLATVGGFRVCGYGYGYDSMNGSFVNTPRSYGYDSDYKNANVYHVEKSAPAVRKVVPPQPAYDYLCSSWNYSDNYAGDYKHFRNCSTARVRVSPENKWDWDFFNPFAVLDDGYQGYDPIVTHGYGSNSTSPDLREVRRREGIPDLEEETEIEVCKEDLWVKREKAEAKQSSRERNLGSRQQLNEKPWSPLQYKEETQNPPFRDLKEVVAEIRNDFETASGYGKEVELMLEVEKLPYRPGFLEVILSRMLHLIVPCLKFTGSLTRPEISCFEDVGEGVNAAVCELSSTLDKLYAWEKKLLKEVKDEERLRAKYEKKYKRLRILDEEGAEPGKIYAAQTSIRRLRTKLDITIRAIDSISSMIHMLRDEELLPRVAELIHGLIKIWKAMLKCHQNQFRAITELKTQYLKPKTGPNSDTKLENELLLWCRHFKDWIGFQKSYAESLNGWLLKTLQFDTQENLEKPGFYSPGQIGAPPIFVICNDWQKALACISDGEVGKAMNGFTKLLLGKRDDEEHERVEADEYRERSIRAHLGKGKMEGERDSVLDKRGSRDGLVRVFRALEEFTGEVLRAHEHVRFEDCA